MWYFEKSRDTGKLILAFKDAHLNFLAKFCIKKLLNTYFFIRNRVFPNPRHNLGQNTLHNLHKNTQKENASLQEVAKF